jgi:hypothetical protein
MKNYVNNRHIEGRLSRVLESINNPNEPLSYEGGKRSVPLFLIKLIQGRLVP